jgi:hypothetical protein
MSDQLSNSAGNDNLDAAVAIANQYANTILLALRTIHEYVAPRAAAHGIKLSAREQHAWAVSLSIALSQGKVHHRMPATRLEKPKPPQKKAPSKSIQPQRTELFARTEQVVEPAKALHKVRQMMEIVSMGESELLSILRESGCQEAMFATSLSAIPDKVLRRCIERWETIQELAEVSRPDNGEAA